MAAVRQELAQPVGSLTQMGTLRIGQRADDRTIKIKDFVPLAELNDLVFGGWDVYEDNVFEAATKAKVLEPLVLDLALFGDLARRANLSGVQEWLSFYFKSPQAAGEVRPEHDIFKQLIRLHNQLRQLMGEDLLSQLGVDNVDENQLEVL